MKIFRDYSSLALLAVAAFTGLSTGADCQQPKITVEIPGRTNDAKQVDQPMAKVNQMANNQNQIPDYAYYLSFFHHYMGLQKFADELDAMGKDGGEARTSDQIEAGINDNEAMILKQCIEEFTVNELALNKQLKATGVKYGFVSADGQERPGNSQANQSKHERWDSSNGSLNPSSKIQPALSPSQTAAYQEDVRKYFVAREQLVKTFISRLRAQLGDATFQKLDHHVKTFANLTVARPQPEVSK